MMFTERLEHFVDTTLTGLGRLYTLILSAVYGRVSFFLVGESGSGKTTLIKLLPFFSDSLAYTSTSPTWSGIASWLVGNARNDFVEVRGEIRDGEEKVESISVKETSIDFRFNDLADFSSYSVDKIIPVISELITDRELSKQALHTDEGVFDLFFEDVSVIICGAIQPIILGKMMETGSWYGLTKDRVLLLPVINPLYRKFNTETYTKEPKVFRKKIRSKFSFPPLNFKKAHNVEFESRDAYELLSKRLAYQSWRKKTGYGIFSKKRADKWGKWLLQGFAYLNGKKRISEALTKYFVDRYGVYLQMFKTLRYCDNPSSPPRIHFAEYKVVSTLLNRNTKLNRSELAEHMSLLSKDYISQLVRPLKKLDMVKRNSNTYKPHQKLIEFFTSYIKEVSEL